MTSYHIVSLIILPIFSHPDYGITVNLKRSDGTRKKPNPHYFHMGPTENKPCGPIETLDPIESTIDPTENMKCCIILGFPPEKTLHSS